MGPGIRAEEARRARKRRKGRERKRKEEKEAVGQLAGRADKLLTDFPSAFLALCR